MTKGYYKGVGLHSKRYRVFLLSGTKCAICGIEAQYFAQEKFKEHNKFHMNLYAVRNDREVLMTRDHIIPRSKGGSDNLDNQQTMCFYCNTRKGDKVE
jgi:5-methylcytosine-specific restriction endonuclease McrA